MGRIHRDDRTLLSKNPAFCGWLQTLLDAHPDARFVRLDRDPFESIPSQLELVYGEPPFPVRSPQDE